MSVRHHLYHNDLPSGLSLGNVLAVDCSVAGDNPWRDRLCGLRLYDGDADGGAVHIVQFDADGYAGAVNLARVLADRGKEKIFYFARGDMQWIGQWLGVIPDNVYCLKIASRLARTYTQSHGLDDILRQVLGVRLPRAPHPAAVNGPLAEEQVKYLCNDVVHLHAARAQLGDMLAREGRAEIVAGLQACLPAIVRADLAGWRDEDVFSAHIPKPL